MVALFLYGDEPLRACSHKDQRRTKKTAPAPAGCRFAFGSMMARGGPGCATTGSKSQLNRITLNSLSDTGEAYFLQLGQHLDNISDDFAML